MGFEVHVNTPAIGYNPNNTYAYAPALVKIGSSIHAWYGKGIYVGGNPYNDAIVHVVNSGSDTVELCPTYGGANDVQSSYPLCQADYDPGQLTLTGQCPRDLAGNACYAEYRYLSEVVGWDWGFVNDPSVVMVNGVYYLYFVAPRTGGCDNGVNNQIFVARSTDGVHWTKYPDNAHFPIPAVGFSASGACGPFNAQGTTDRYGIGEPSVVYKGGRYYLYYTNNPWLNEAHLERVQSSDGVTFGNAERVTAGNTIDGAYGSGGGAEVRYIPGWDVWLMIISIPGNQKIRWNISRDGVHWLPPAFKTTEREFPTMNSYGISPTIEADPYGWIGDSTLTTTKSTDIGYTTGNPNDPLTWDIAISEMTLTAQAAYGTLESVDASSIATGWSYDLDAGTNDAASNGSVSAPLGHDLWVRPVGVNVNNGQRFEGNWQSAQLSRPDLVTAGFTPDQYHGYSVDLKTQGFPDGIRHDHPGRRVSCRNGSDYAHRVLPRDVGHLHRSHNYYSAAVSHHHPRTIDNPQRHRDGHNAARLSVVYRRQRQHRLSCPERHGIIDYRLADKHDELLGSHQQFLRIGEQQYRARDSESGPPKDTGRFQRRSHFRRCSLSLRDVGRVQPKQRR
jgi:hypothetical protein